MEIKDIMLDVIDKKYDELNLGLENNDIFWKVRFFEGNAIGQIGETFVKKVFTEYGIPMKDIGK